ncbi:hypothetical protein SO802_025517 [Lithocarpus litseifolius]|uniref:Uncharacterized protein n=1 Tax=Lithocarpus litseifolius TaxID=425828 RepID=A0AAW2BZ04_9ROSI
MSIVVLLALKILQRNLPQSQWKIEKLQKGGKNLCKDGRYLFLNGQIPEPFALSQDRMHLGSLGELKAQISGQNFTMTLHSGSALYKIRFIASVKN